MEIAGARSSSLIVNTAVPSLITTAGGFPEGLDNVMVTVSFASSIASVSMATGIFCVVTPGAKVIVPLAAV